MQTSREIILAMANQRGILRARDLGELNLPHVELARLVDKGRLLQLSRGLYSLPDRVVTEQASLAEVAIKFPKALHEAWHSKRISMDKVWEYAQICRVNNVMRPYLESLNG